ncbi:unnamed protein product [Rhizoctonia solani]|uniref:Protein kinase domain-containing protein n=1 Tax=Rhizoctonia solani TaxID=456999 RepID=A0A8H3CQ57_9AGAM|nr:unnamed protein product [Rhizoctonia solani]
MGRLHQPIIFPNSSGDMELEGESTHEGSGAQSPVIVTRNTMIDQILGIFKSRGVHDLTGELDSSATPAYPVAVTGLADIYRARLLNGSSVALKCLRVLSWGDAPDKSLKEISRELYTWSKCKHPNVLELIGISQFRGQIALISPWMMKGSLVNFLRNEPNVSRYELCTQLAGAITYLHDVGIVHGDIKGSNILVSEDCKIKLGSFENAQISQNSIQFSVSEETSALSIRWAAPELIMEENHRATLHTDVYSLGMTILVRQLSTPPAAMVRGVLPKRPAQLANGENLPDVVWSLLLSCWNVDPPSRPSASEVWEAMKTLTSATAENDSHVSYIFSPC